MSLDINNLIDIISINQIFKRISIAHCLSSFYFLYKEFIKGWCMAETILVKI